MEVLSLHIGNDYIKKNTSWVEMKKETHIFCSLVQDPISGGIEPEKLFELIPLHVVYKIRKHQSLLERSSLKTLYNIWAKKGKAKLTVILDL